MSTRLNITLKSLIGAKPFFDLDPTANPTVNFPNYKNKERVSELLDGSEVVTQVAKGMLGRAQLGFDPLDQPDAQTLEEMVASNQDFVISPPYTSDAILYLGLQASLDEMREPLTQGEATFARKCKKANTVTGQWSDYDVPVFENCGPGQGLHVTDPTLHEDYISYEFKRYLTANAEDDGTTTLITILPVDAAILENEYNVDNDDIYMISTEGETPNTLEPFQVKSINTTTGVITATTANDGGAEAALGSTSSYTKAARSYITAVTFVSDAEMEDEGTGSWADFSSPELVEKTQTQQETGSRALKIISAAGGVDGALQVVGTVPAGTDLSLWLRVFLVRGNATVRLVNVTDTSNIISETLTLHTSVGSWGWFRVCGQVGGAGQKELRIDIFEAGGAGLEVIVDRCYLMKNRVPNGGMEADANGLYDAEDTVATSTAVDTTFDATHAYDDGDDTEWDLSNVVAGMIAEADGKEGLVTAVDNEGQARSVTVDSWIGGTPANGNACTVSFAVAPGWNNSGADVADDQLWQDDDEHGGTWAQGVSVDGNEGIITDANVVSSGFWYLVGAHLKVDTGTAKIVTGALEINVDSATTGVYEFVSAVGLMTGNRTITIRADGGAAVFLVDDVMAIKLIGSSTSGGPNDDCYIDLHEPLSTTAITIELLYRPDLANTAIPVNSYLFAISRRTYDSTDNILVLYHPGNGQFQLYVESGGTVKVVTLNKTFSAGDDVSIVARCTDGVNLELSVAVAGAAATAAETADGAIDIPSGLTRLWLRRGSGFNNQPLGSVSNVSIKQIAIADADVTAWHDRFADDEWLNLIKIVDGRQGRVTRTTTPHIGGTQMQTPISWEERTQNKGAMIAQRDI